ncbi:ATP-binding protein [Halanaeroarchaeum sulfurireducens]|uniref:histidine kinase n=1 Tax=Halanaeroarchaeum sulfurireducens TaxID=1604004 RepID=A0A0F7P8I5_9EURY|nr:ATP-binding protein [Halanaeroarchaeum sulfurireducens]AKH97476.1 signal-transducing histidine kinase [Halanaeroarchaeum sulfurireducens]ALG81872.1 signal-transducing histidine kinase [Halanaeroarchaeum sulfurireducens]
MGEARKWVNMKNASFVIVLLVPVFVWLFTDPVPVLFQDPRLVSIGNFSVIEHGNSSVYVLYLSAFYVIATIGLSYIVYQTWTDQSLSRGQTAILVPGIFAPMLLSVAQTFQFLPFESPGTILTPTSFSVGMAAVGYAAFRYEIFDTKALARSRTIDNMNEGYLLVDTDGKIIDANRRALTLLETATPLTGTQISTLFTCQENENMIEGGPTPTFEKSLDTETGTRTLEVSTANFATSHGQTLGTLFVMRDITARKDAERQLVKQRDNIAFLNQMLRHDIRNHLQGILGGANLLAEEIDMTTEKSEYLSMIDENAENAVDLTKSARDIANVMLESETELEPVALEPILTEEVKRVRNSYENVTVEVEGAIPHVSVRANDMIGSIFRNLFENAVKHNDSDRPKVTLAAEESDDHLSISVADNGPGIPDEMKDQIFTKGETGLNSESTGIGLYLVRSLVDSYDGSVTVEDNEPRGSIFTVTIPTLENH